MRTWLFSVLLAVLPATWAQAPATSDKVQYTGIVPVDISQAVDPGRIKLRSSAVLVLDPAQGKALLARNERIVKPIASITKLMTAMVVLDAKMPLDQPIAVTDADVDRLKGTHSRLLVGTRLPRRELLRLALMSSENRAAAALAHSYPGGSRAFLAAMNRKSASLGMSDTRFEDPTGLSSGNVSSARDLARMVLAAHRYPLIREFTTTASHVVNLHGKSGEVFKNTNRLVQSGNAAWQIGLSKTGYTAEAGRCLVMHARIGVRPVVVVLLDSWGKLTPIGDANRIRRWMETQPARRRVG